METIRKMNHNLKTWAFPIWDALRTELSWTQNCLLLHRDFGLFFFVTDDVSTLKRFLTSITRIVLNFYRFLTSFGMTAFLFKVWRKGRQSRPFLSHKPKSNVIPNAAKRNEESQAPLRLLYCIAWSFRLIVGTASQEFKNTYKIKLTPYRLYKV